MASARERRAALIRAAAPAAAEASIQLLARDEPEGSSDSKAAEAPAGNPADAGANPAPPTKHSIGRWLVEPEEEPSMKILFQSVHLEKAIPRLPGGDRGLATSDTTHFDAVRHKVVIEYDTATQLVRLANERDSIFVHVSKVERFGDVYVPEAVAKSTAA